MKIQFICAFGKNKQADIGIGHLKRCIKLAIEFDKKGHQSNFLVFGSNLSESGLKNKFIQKIDFLSLDSFPNIEKLKDLKFEYSDFTFLDISNSFFLKFDKNFNFILDKLKINTKCLIVIDGLGVESYINQSQYSNEYDYLIAPYFGAEITFKKAKNHLLGPKFFISEDSISGFRKKIKKMASNVLITCGGSDPQNITYEILKSLHMMNQSKIKLKIIIGPNFYDKHIEKIKKLVTNNSMEVDYIKSPESLQNYIKSSDVVIATSGLTKYEILSTGTPSIIIPFDKKQFKLNIESSKTGAFLTINRDKIMTDLKKELVSLIENKNLRLKMSTKATELIDGKGIGRIIKNIGI